MNQEFIQLLARDLNVWSAEISLVIVFSPSLLMAREQGLRADGILSGFLLVAGALTRARRNQESKPFRVLFAKTREDFLCLQRRGEGAAIVSAQLHYFSERQ